MANFRGNVVPFPPKPDPPNGADAQREARQAFLPDGDIWRLDLSGCWAAGFYEMKEDKKRQWCEGVREMILAEALRRGADLKLDENDLGRTIGNDPADLKGWLGDIAAYLAPKETGLVQIQTASGAVVPFEQEAKASRSDSCREQNPSVPVKIYTYDEMVNLPAPDFAVHGLVVCRAKNVMFGPSNVFKSFIATDLGGSVSTGNTYHGLAVKKIKVFYVANEGAHGVGRKRIAAWMAYHGIPLEARRNIFLIKAETILPNEISRNNLLAAIRLLVEPGEDFFIIFDVLRGTMTGSESDDEAAHAWTAADEILIAEGATILTVTHSPYSEDARMRGHSHLWGSFDARLQVEGDKDKRTALLKIDRIKDHESTGQCGFTLEEQETDEHPGEFSLVPRLDGNVKAHKTKGPRLTKAAKIALDALQYAIDECGGVPPACSHIPSGVKCVTLKQWREYAFKLGISASDEPRTQRSAFQRGTEALIAVKAAVVWGDHAWPV